MARSAHLPPEQAAGVIVDARVVHRLHQPVWAFPP